MKIITEAYQEVLNESSIPALVKKIQALTNNNDHTESVIVLAKYLDDKNAVRKLKEIESQNQKLGHTPIYLIDRRRYILNNLLKLVKQKFGDNTYNVVYNAF